MTMDTNYQVRRGVPSEDEIVAENFHGMWMDISMPPEAFEENWKQIVMDSIQHVRKNLKGSTFVVVNDRNDIVGSCVCQIYDSQSLHPDIIKKSYYQCGYLWGVYVRPECRNEGLAKKMISACTEYFKEIGCSEVKLWASDKGKPVYQHEGYEFITKGIQEMVLSLK